jgi:hypothetical protein
MNALEEKLRTAMRETGEEITRSSVPPLRPAGGRRRAGLGGGGRFAAGRLSVWLTPVAAAAGVAAVVAASLAISATFHGIHRPAPHSAAEKAALARVPAYFVALEGGNPQGQKRAVVTATATGSVLAAVKPPSPYNVFSWVSAASDDRTFVLAAHRYWKIAPGSGGAAAEERDNAAPTKFFRLTFDPATHAAHLTKLAVPGKVKTTELAGVALSPGGTKLALDLRQSIQVTDLATGTTRTWVWHGSGWIGNDKPSGQAMSWAADSRTLAFQQHTGPNGANVEVSLLDTATPGGNLRAASRVALSIAGGTVKGTVTGNTLITPDGTMIVAATMTEHGGPTRKQAAESLLLAGQRQQLARELVRLRAKQALAQHPSKGVRQALNQQVRYVEKQLATLKQRGRQPQLTTDVAITEFSVATGKPVRVLDRERFTGNTGWQEVDWANASGTAMIIDNSGPAAKPGTFTGGIGVLTGNTFTPLPRLQSFFYLPSAW